MNDLSPRPLPRFMTVTDVAEVLCLPSAEVFDLLASTELRGILIGSPAKWRIEASELDAYIEAKYEETRRRGLWHEANLASVVELDRIPAAAPARSEIQ